MEKGKAFSYFLGANTPGGFYSLYDHFTEPDAGDFLWVIKGGPGCGKSGFMRRIGAAILDAGLDVEYILCSGDPDSLDGIYIPEKRIAYVDGTAPHVIEPPYCGAGGRYLDLSGFTDTAALRQKLPLLLEKNRRYKDQYRHAYTLLRALPSLSASEISGLLTAEDHAAVLRRAEGAVNRTMRKRGGAPGKVKKRFLGAFSRNGQLFCTDTVKALCSRVYLLDNTLGLADDYLREISESAVQRGYMQLCCPDPLSPERLQAVLLPELSLGYIAADAVPDTESLVSRHIRLDRLPEEARLSACRGQIRALAKQRTQLLSQAQYSLTQAKALHDALEALYNPHVDFAGIRAEADKHIAELLQ